MLTIEQIYHIKNVAKDLFSRSLLTPVPNRDRAPEERIVTDSELVQEILSIIGDSGLMYLSVWDNLTELWGRFRNNDDLGICQWLLQTATTFRILAFSTEEEYDRWIDHLTRSYCAHARPNDRVGRNNDVEASIAIDDEYIDRLPVDTEYRNLLIANPWFVYLISLQLSYHEIYAELLVSQLSDEKVLTLTGKGDTMQ